MADIAELLESFAAREVRDLSLEELQNQVATLKKFEKRIRYVASIVRLF
jgi:hypothetical protein